jgi:mobilome CxxCx(11)CxxC protein
MESASQLGDDPVQPILTECANQAFHATGTAWIFEQRAKRLGRQLNLLTYLSFLVPLLVGGLVVGYGANAALLPYTVSIGAGLGILLSLVSAWSVVFKWVDSQAYANESMAANRRLARRYTDLIQVGASSHTGLKIQYDLLRLEDQLREELDNRQSIRDAEDRAAMRAALRQTQRDCAACKQVPTSLKASNCDVCGDFWRTPLGIVGRFHFGKGKQHDTEEQPRNRRVVGANGSREAGGPGRDQ